MAVMKSPHSKKSRSEPALAPSSRVRSTLAGVDLNLLVALDALLAERSVTQAARRLGLTQSALSHVLARLRLLLDDPLLIKTPRAMVPTALALELEAPLRSALAELERTLRRRPRFDPATSRRQFTIASADYAMLVLIPRLMRHITAVAPLVSLTVQPTTTDSPHELPTGQLDLILGAVPPEVPDVLGRRLLDERFVCLVRREHPSVRATLTLEQYVALPHVLISPMGRGVSWVDPVLERLGQRRHIALRIPHFLVAPLIVAQTDMILTVAARVAQALGTALPVREVVPPIAIPGFTVSMYWHAQRSDDPGHKWLRDLLAAVAVEVMQEETGRPGSAVSARAATASRRRGEPHRDSKSGRKSSRSPDRKRSVPAKPPKRSR